MILPFSTQINGKPTNFVGKIWKGLFPITEVDIFDWLPKIAECNEKGLIPNGTCAEESLREFHPKIHTIRKDEKDRWKPGMMIDFFINNRSKNAFRFAPRIQVVSRQRVFMTFLPQCGVGFRVSIDGQELEEHEVETLALNDGFDAVEDFEDYFISQMIDDEFSGKIIHWTNFKYE